MRIRAVALAMGMAVVSAGCIGIAVNKDGSGARKPGLDIQQSTMDVKESTTTTSETRVIREKVVPAGDVGTRGFLYPAEFAAMLKPNPLTATAAPRRETHCAVYTLAAEARELARQSEASYSVELPSAPIAARLALQIWHQGTDDKPRVTVNGNLVGTLETSPVSLAERNFIVFAFDGEGGGTSYQLDYQGWQGAQLFISGSQLKAGRNSLSISVGSDQVAVRDVHLEVLTALDDADTVHDMRSEGNRAPLPRR